MPGNVDVVPGEQFELRRKHHHGTQHGDDGGVEPVQFIRGPDEQYQQEDNCRFDFVQFDGTQFSISFGEGFSAAGEFRLAVFLSEWEDESNADQIRNDAESENERQPGSEPIKVVDRDAGPGEDGNPQ